MVKPAWVFVEIVVQDHLGHNVYGTYASLFSLVLVFSVLADWGLNHYSTQQIASDKEKYSSIFNSLFFVRLLIIVAFPFVLAGIGWVLQYSFEDIKLLFILAVIQSMIHFIMFFRAKLQAFQAFKTDGVISVLERVVLIIIVLFLIQDAFDLNDFILARLLAVSVVTIFAYVLVSSLYGWVRLYFSRKEIYSALKAAFPFTLVTLLYSINERIDMVMIERLFSGYEAGLYAASYRWYDALMMFVWAIMPIFFSKFANAKAKRSGASSLLNQGFLLVSIPMLLIVPFLFFDGEFLFYLLRNSVKAEVQLMNTFFQILLVSFIFNAFFVLQGTYLNASGHVKKVNVIVVLAIITNIILNWIFIPKYGALAAGISTAISTAILGLGYYILIMLSRLRVDMKGIFSVFLAFSFSFCTYAFLKQKYDTIYLSAIVSVIVFLSVLFLFGIHKRIGKEL